MKFLLLFFLFFSVACYADELKKDETRNYSVRVFAGFSSASDFDELYTFTGLNKSPYNTNVLGVDGGYRLVRDMFGLPVDIYAKGGLSYFDENYHQADFLEMTLYLKLFIKLNLFDNQFRVGIGEGVSYAGRVPYTEAQEAIRENDNQSNFLNYMEITVDFDIGKLIRVDSMRDYHLGYLIKHRSGIHGLYGGVYDGGSNYNCIYVEKNF